MSTHPHDTDVESDPADEATEEDEESVSEVAERLAKHTVLDEVIVNPGLDAEYLEPLGIRNHPDLMETRLKNASQMDTAVYPDGQGVYVFPEEEYTVDLTAHHEQYGERGTCDCGDFYYRGAAMGFDCKHILYVKRLISNGYLPPRDEPDPRSWVGLRVGMFIEYLDEVIEETISDVLSDEIRDIQDKLRDELENPMKTDLVSVERRVEQSVPARIDPEFAPTDPESQNEPEN